MLDNNYKRCAAIAQELEDITDGRLYRCPHCRNEFNIDDLEEYETEDGETAIKCSDCEEELIVDELESLTVYDYFENSYDVEYTLDYEKQYKSIKIWVAVGGPSIWVDTNVGEVKLAWWGQKASADLSKSACDMIDEYGEELYGY